MTRRRISAWLVWIPALILASSVVAAFVRVQMHTEDEQQHLTREVLQREYVPRTEYEKQIANQNQMLRDIYDEVKETRKYLREH